jgi:hypothetical protein
MYSTAHKVGEKFDHAVRIIIINRLDNMAVTSWFYIITIRGAPEFFRVVVPAGIPGNLAPPKIIS